MKFLRYLLIASAILAALPAQAQIAAFKHIIIIVQENRTPDNLFLELCNPPAAANCGPLTSQYDILTTGWNNKGSFIPPVPVDLATRWDIEHHHDPDWLAMCHLNPAGTACQMDRAANEICIPGKTAPCPTTPPPAFHYVQRYTGGADILGPYISIALTYGWANKMFATNQGPSFEAHQFIYGATSAPTVNSTENDDANGIYAAENASGCLDTPDAKVKTIIKSLENGTTTYPCFTHPTLGTALFSSPTPWRYYTPYTPGENDDNLWTAPEAILSECGVSNQGNTGTLYTACIGPEFAANSNVVSNPRQVLVDISKCHLQSLNWVIPEGQYSDHAGMTTDLGPQWVASIVNWIGASQCHDSGKTYWQDTAIIITWDDWGGWYDHEAPKLDPLGYQLGFRVPLLFVSAYGPKSIANGQCLPNIDGDDILDFGSIADFIEGNFLTREGLLGFADQRALNRGNLHPDLSSFFDITKADCTFVPVPILSQPQQYDANYFINDTSPVLPPDDE